MRKIFAEYTSLSLVCALMALEFLLPLFIIVKEFKNI